MILQAEIQQRIDAVCPNEGMSFGKLEDKSTWEIHFDEKATEEQKAKAKEVLDSFEWNEDDKKEAELNDLVEKHKDDLLYRKAYKEYKECNPIATFKDFIRYLKTIDV